MRPCVPWILVSLSALASHAQAARGQSGEPRLVTIHRTEVPIVIDGRMSEAAWRDAPALGDFTQVDPEPGAAPSEPTDVRVLHDDDSLYLFVRCHDSEPGRIAATEMRRDGPTDTDDFVSIVLDTYQTQRSGYLFTLGPAGLRGDALLEGNFTRDAWDGIWDSASRVDGEGWAVEVAIPFKSLAFDPRRGSWSLNVERTLRRLNEVSRWSGAKRELEITDLGGSGTLEGFTGTLDQGHGLTLKPFVVLSSEIDDGLPEFDAGLDLFYRVTPEVTAALTVNTDFAEAEVDERRVNLTRFPLFFEEKRDFFLEEAGVFEFGGIRQSPRPFFSRRIGIVGGQEKGILAGGRLTGRVGRTRFGLINVQMEDDDELGSKNLSVARAVVDVLEESSVGFIATNGNPGERGENQLAGADFQYVDSDFLGDSILRAGLSVQGTRDDPDAGEERLGYAVGGRAQYQSDRWNLFGFVSQVDDRYRPALGFVSRPGEREHIARATRTLRPEWPGIRTVEIASGVEFFTTLRDTVNTLEYTILSGEITTDARDFVLAEALFERDRITGPFEISEGVVIPVDSYGWFYANLRAGTDPSKPVAAEAGVRAGGFYEGTRTDYTAEVSLRPGPRFQGSLEGERRDIDLPEGDFTVDILRARGTLQFSPELTLDTIVQWDSVSDLAGLNARLRWEPVPGQEIFLVYNESYDADESFTSEDREAILKLGVSLRF